MIYLDVIPAFEITLYAIVTILFAVTGFLNLKDLKTLRQEKWTRQDTAALTLRTAFYAAFLSSLLILLTTVLVMSSSLTILRTSISMRQVLPLAITSLEFSFGILLVTGVIYGVAKWKDWYDLIDAED